MSETTPSHNLKAVIRETGLNAETLRAWERRYGLLKPQRSQGGHRLYSQRDINMIKWLVERQREGLSISRAVDMWRSLAESGQDPLMHPAAPAMVPGAAGAALEELRRAWISACLNFDEQASERVLSQAFAIAPPEAVCLNVLQKGLFEIGEQWYTGEVSVQQEHFSSALAMRRLHALVAAAPPPARPGRILAACPPGEEHEFSLLMSTFFLRRYGWDVVYLGANVPLARLEMTIRITAPTLVLSVAQTLPAAASMRQMSLVLEKQKVTLAYGGGIFIQLPDLQPYIAGYYTGEDMADLARQVENMLGRPTIRPTAERLPPEYQTAYDLYLEKLPEVEATVSGLLRSAQIAPGHLERANVSITQHLKAALSFGNLDLLRHSIEWVEGLLHNYGLPPHLIKLYIESYRTAVDNHMGEQGRLITHGFDELIRVGQE